MSKKRINSRAKGARIEREAAAFLTKLGYPCERMARIGKSADDLHCPTLACHIEVKGDESIGVGTKALRAAWEQADAQASAMLSDPTAYVLWKRKRRGWFLTWKHWLKANERGMSSLVLVTVGESDIAAVLEQWKIKEGGR